MFCATGIAHAPVRLFSKAATTTTSRIGYRCLLSGLGLPKGQRAAQFFVPPALPTLTRNSAETNRGNRSSHVCLTYLNMRTTLKSQCRERNTTTNQTGHDKPQRGNTKVHTGHCEFSLAFFCFFLLPQLGAMYNKQAESAQSEVRRRPSARDYAEIPLITHTLPCSLPPLQTDKSWGADCVGRQEVFADSSSV